MKIDFPHFLAPGVPTLSIKEYVWKEKISIDSSAGMKT